jgi:hypothetical protein
LTSETLAEVTKIYEGSNGDATTALYKRLEALGAPGTVAMNLFRAQKASERAKRYRRRAHSQQAYDKKAWSMGLLCRCLAENADRLAVIWGWGRDEKAVGFENVLYVDLPTGQASFHTDHRLEGPDHPTGWCGRGISVGVIIAYTVRVLDQQREAA